MTFEEVEKAIGLIIVSQDRMNRMMTDLLETARTSLEIAQHAVTVAEKASADVSRLEGIVEDYIRSLRNGKGGAN